MGEYCGEEDRQRHADDRAENDGRVAHRGEQELGLEGLVAMRGQDVQQALPHKKRAASREVPLKRRGTG
jgi:hypothetical protein